MAKVKKLFLGWLAKPGLDAKGEFWKMAAGKATESPFHETMTEARLRLDEHLERAGTRPQRRTEDRGSEVNFRRLRAALEVMEDPDHEFLDEVASEGVPIGVDVELPRTPLVYEQSTRRMRSTKTS